MDGRYELRMLSRPFVTNEFDGDRFAQNRAGTVACIALDAPEGDTRLVVDHCKTHSRFVDIELFLAVLDAGDALLIERPGGAGRHTGDIRTHIARNVPWNEIGCTHRQSVSGLGHDQRIVGARFRALPAFDAGAQKVVLGQSRRRTEQKGRRFRLFHISHPDDAAQRRQADTLSHDGQKTPSFGDFGFVIFLWILSVQRLNPPLSSI